MSESLSQWIWDTNLKALKSTCQTTGHEFLRMATLSINLRRSQVFLQVGCVCVCVWVRACLLDTVAFTSLNFFSAPWEHLNKAIRQHMCTRITTPTNKNQETYGNLFRNGRSQQARQHDSSVETHAEPACSADNVWGAPKLAQSNVSA